MKQSRIIYKRIESMLPKKYTSRIKQMMIYSGIKINYKEWIGFFFSYSIGLSILISLLLYILGIETIYLPAIFFISFILMQAFSELLLSMSSYSRTKFIESILPEFLSLLSSNIKSGLNVDQAFLLSVRDEFGGFKEDISQASKDTLMGKNFSQAILSMNENINSKLFSKTTNLLVEGINNGGNISNLLDNIVEDMRATSLIKREIKAGISMYTLILIIAICMGAPALFSVAIYEVESLQSFIKIMPSNQGFPSSININLNTQSIDVNTIKIIIMISLAVNNIFGALMISLLDSGKSKEGIKLIPILLLVSFSIYFGVNYLVNIFFPII